MENGCSIVEQPFLLFSVSVFVSFVPSFVLFVVYTLRESLPALFPALKKGFLPSFFPNACMPSRWLRGRVGCA